ncbi:MAG: ABC transporter permease [Solirubrobacterales bacterium]
MNALLTAPTEAAGLLAQIEIQDRSGDAATCVARDGFYCPGWVADNIDTFFDPTFEHVKLVVISVGIGFLIAFGMALISHSRGWLVPPLTAFTGVLYTIPSLAAFFLLIPITGRGADTAIIALTAYTLQIIYRNIITGLNNVPDDVVAAGRGMGLTNRQLLLRVELPLALPEIIAGVRVATVTTVGLATLAVFAGGGGLGGEILSDLTFRTRVATTGLIAIGMAIIFDLILLAIQRFASPWKRVQTA